MTETEETEHKQSTTQSKNTLPATIQEATGYNVEQESSHFQPTGFLIPSRAGGSFKVFINVNRKPVFVGLVSKAALLKSLGSQPMKAVQISRFRNENESNPRQRVSIPIADAEKLKGVTE